mmetsp:Transcript_90045/g.290945  ORF Transcript_90045/g.290945 Transcript_90045/m.290945 type:complete len:266 (-) Transcript_90045:432-1229(-)
MRGQGVDRRLCLRSRRRHAAARRRLDVRAPAAAAAARGGAAAGHGLGQREDGRGGQRPRAPLRQHRRRGTGGHGRSAGEVGDRHAPSIARRGHAAHHRSHGLWQQCDAGRRLQRLRGTRMANGTAGGDWLNLDRCLVMLLLLMLLLLLLLQLQLQLLHLQLQLLLLLLHLRRHPTRRSRHLHRRGPRAVPLRRQRRGHGGALPGHWRRGLALHAIERPRKHTCCARGCRDCRHRRCSPRCTSSGRWCRHRRGHRRWRAAPCCRRW